MMLKIKMVQRVVAGLTFFLALLTKMLLNQKPHHPQHQKQSIVKSDDSDDDDSDDDSYGLSWRLAVETNNLHRWRTVPPRCYKHVEKYMTGGQFEKDLKLITEQILVYASEIEISLAGDGMDAWILDVDDTCISNICYYKAKGFGCDPFDSTNFKAWIMRGKCPANHAVLKLFNELIERRFKVFLLTGRDEATLGKITTDNLHNEGFIGYERLILRTTQYKGQSAVIYKSAIRKEIEGRGYRIRGNVGDQWSDLQGQCVGNRIFKLPNPMYHIS